MTIRIDEDFDIPGSTPQQRGTGAGRNYARGGLLYARAAWRALVERHAPAAPLKGPVDVAIRLAYHGRADAPKTTRPDLDNLAKCALDAMTKAGFWLDDAQVCGLRVSKQWTTGESHVAIHVQEMDVV